MSALPLILAVGAGIAGIWLLSKTTAGSQGVYMLPGKFYYSTYVGKSRNLKEILGDCYQVIQTVDIYDEETDDWIPPADPANFVLQKGTVCRLQMQQPCTVYGFKVERVV
ncbi:hypothetical protein LCGC14_2128120 [marine sediment metagenome]|uniref:Uncharacterized protein n=1 Tax=marine sediment metagenome TaxID=412755 RepID=A0A0F9EPC2_9ZZZZ